MAGYLSRPVSLASRQHPRELPRHCRAAAITRFDRFAGLVQPCPEAAGAEPARRADGAIRPRRRPAKFSAPSSRKSGSHLTPRWREMDSNPRSPERATSVFKRPVRRNPPSSTRRNEGSPASASAASQADRVFSPPITLIELPWPVRLTRLHRQRIVALLSGAATSCGTGNIRKRRYGERSGRPDLGQQVNQDLDRHNQQEGERRAEQKDGGDDRPCGPSSKTTHRMMSRSIRPWGMLRATA